MVKYKDKIKLLREYFSSLSFSTFDLMAGMTSTLIFYYITDVPWIMILFPVLLTLRGDLAGVFTGVLTTSLHQVKSVRGSQRTRVTIMDWFPRFSL